MSLIRMMRLPECTPRRPRSSLVSSFVPRVVPECAHRVRTQSCDNSRDIRLYTYFVAVGISSAPISTFKAVQDL